MVLWERMERCFLRRNYFAKIVKYMKNVYKIKQKFKRLTDGRKNPKYKTHLAILPVLLGFILRVRSFNELNNMIKEKEFNNVLPKGLKLPKIDAIRDTLKVVDLSKLREILREIVCKARENKVFDKGTIDGLVVVAVDGTQTFNSDKKSCENCLTAIKKGKKEQRNFHSSVVLSTIGEGPKLVIDFEQYKPGEDNALKDEGELTAAKRLIKRVSKEHKNFIDVVVYDALACNSEWINICNQSNIDVVVRVKNNNIKSIKEIKRQINKSEPVVVWTDIKAYESVTVFEDKFHMDGVEKELRFIKFHMKKPNKSRTQLMIVTTCMHIELATLYKIIRTRQDIENSIFHNLKTECGLEHCFVHGGNAIEVVLCLIYIASNMVQLFYYRRLKKSLKTQVELIRQLIKGLYTLKFNMEYIINTG
jgi:hypothetical protein